MKKKILLAILGLLVIIQFFRIDKTVAQTDPNDDYLSTAGAPEEVTALIKQVCYNCHSVNTKYPWYSNIAPVSWWLKHHVDEAQEHLNFSKWGDYSPKQKKHKLEECFEEVEEGEMPLKSYTWTHKEARLSDGQRELLENWFREEYRDEPGM